MDPGTVITLCKENIQPLRHGRNATQLGTALRAQEDTEVQQLLLQEKKKYEDAIQNYEGDDPLENWYEYILWVEQSYPKNGHESHMDKLLKQCLLTFEKDKRYNQDRRFVRLWINYINVQKNPIELYQMLYNSGIGTMIADMYMAWAFELEQVDDFRKADEVYQLGILAGAQPRDELQYARKNFQLFVGRKALGFTEVRSEVALSEQRQAFSSLRAINAGRQATIVRTGHRVRDHVPGTVLQSFGQFESSKSNARIQLWEDEAPRLELKSDSILDHVPIEDIHKENTLKPGQWSKPSKKHRPLMPTSVRPAFTIHEDVAGDDQVVDMEKLRLYPNHTSFWDGSDYPEHRNVRVTTETVAMPNTVVRYSKDLVYADGGDKSMEEIRAENYLNQWRSRLKNKTVDESLLMQSMDITECFNNEHENVQNRIEKIKIKE